MGQFKLLPLACAAVIFLFGMELLRGGLCRLSQHKIQSILSYAAGDMWRAAVLGALVTVLVQSSSVVTSIIVGLAASGVVTMKQSAGLIAGANIGTCSTAFLVHFGMHTNSLRILHGCQPLLILGICIPFLLHKRCPAALVSCGGIFALLTGMVHMQDALKPLSSSPLFTQMLSVCSTPIAGICAGALATAVLQSSSACIAVLQAVSASGVLTVNCAVPMILGQNIGTCSTALLASVKSGKAARFTALLHLAFNTIGTAVVLPVFTVLQSICPQLAAQPVDSAGIACIHLLCNVAAVIPFYLIFSNNPSIGDVPALVRRDRG